MLRPFIIKKIKKEKDKANWVEIDYPPILYDIDRKNKKRQEKTKEKRYIEIIL